MERRFAEIDNLKAAGIATVVLIHCLRSPWDPMIAPAEVWLGHMTRFGVPAFLVASGFLYASDVGVSLRVTARRLRRIVLPYLLVSLAAQAWWAILEVSTETGSFWLDLALGSSMGPYYYVFVITLLVAVTPIFSRLPPRVVAALTIAMIAAQWYVDAAIGMPIVMFWHSRSPLLWWAYFLIGWQFCRHHTTVSRWIAARGAALPIALAIAIAALGAASAASESYLVVRSAAWLNVYAILALIVALSCGRESSPGPLRYLSDSSYAIYLLHLFFVTSIERYLPAPPLRVEFLPIAVAWLFGLLGPIVLLTALQRILGSRSRDVLGA